MEGGMIRRENLSQGRGLRKILVWVESNPLPIRRENVHAK